MYDVITIGTATRDVFLRTGEMKHITDPEHLKSAGFVKGEAGCFALGSKVEVDEFVATVGGGAVNTAVTFARQGFKTASVVKIGDDVGGREVINRFRKEKIHSLASVQSRRPTAYSVILLTPNGDRTILVYRGASKLFSKRDARLSKLDARWAYIAPSNIPLGLMRVIISSLKRRGAQVALNPSRFYIEMGEQKLKPLLNKCDVVIMNKEEASYLTGIDYEKEHKLFRELDKVVEGIVVMTKGREGALLSDGSYLYKAGIYKDSGVVDRTGAGDAFGAGLVAGLMQKNDIAYAMKLASANAASVVEAVGASEGALGRHGLRKDRFRYLDMDIEPLV